MYSEDGSVLYGKIGKDEDEEVGYGCLVASKALNSASLRADENALWQSEMDSLIVVKLCA